MMSGSFVKNQAFGNGHFTKEAKLILFINFSEEFFLGKNFLQKKN